MKLEEANGEWILGLVMALVLGLFELCKLLVSKISGSGETLMESHVNEILDLAKENKTMHQDPDSGFATKLLRQEMNQKLDALNKTTEDGLKAVVDAIKEKD